MDDEIIGFLDESSPQNISNTVRMWSFKRSEKIKNTAKYRINCIGFYAINGTSTCSFMERSRKEDICAFLVEIRRNNPEKKIKVVLDNFASHHAAKVMELSLELRIELIFLPPYSPDLNPIEFIWKSIKRVVSRNFIASEHHMKSLISKSFQELSPFNSFSIGWIRKFIPEEYNKYRKLGI